MCHQVCLKDLTHRVQVCHLRADIGVIDQGSICSKNIIFMVISLMTQLINVRF